MAQEKFVSVLVETMESATRENRSQRRTVIGTEVFPEDTTANLVCESVMQGYSSKVGHSGIWLLRVKVDDDQQTTNVEEDGYVRITESKYRLRKGAIYSCLHYSGLDTLLVMGGDDTKQRSATAAQPQTANEDSDPHTPPSRSRLPLETGKPSADEVAVKPKATIRPIVRMRQPHKLVRQLSDSGKKSAKTSDVIRSEFKSTGSGEVTGVTQSDDLDNQVKPTSKDDTIPTNPAEDRTSSPSATSENPPNIDPNAAPARKTSIPKPVARQRRADKFVQDIVSKAKKPVIKPRAEVVMTARTLRTDTSSTVTSDATDSTTSVKPQANANVASDDSTESHSVPQQDSKDKTTTSHSPDPSIKQKTSLVDARRSPTTVPLFRPQLVQQDVQEPPMEVVKPPLVEETKSKKKQSELPVKKPIKPPLPPKGPNLKQYKDKLAKKTPLTATAADTDSSSVASALFKTASDKPIISTLSQPQSDEVDGCTVGSENAAFTIPAKQAVKPPLKPPLPAKPPNLSRTAKRPIRSNIAPKQKTRPPKLPPPPPPKTPKLDTKTETNNKLNQDNNNQKSLAENAKQRRSSLENSLPSIIEQADITSQTPAPFIKTTFQQPNMPHESHKANLVDPGPPVALVTPVESRPPAENEVASVTQPILAEDNLKASSSLHDSLNYNEDDNDHVLKAALGNVVDLSLQSYALQTDDIQPTPVTSQVIVNADISCGVEREPLVENVVNEVVEKSTETTVSSNETESTKELECNMNQPAGEVKAPELDNTVLTMGEKEGVTNEINEISSDEVGMFKHKALDVQQQEEVQNNLDVQQQKEVQDYLDVQQQEVVQNNLDVQQQKEVQDDLDVQQQKVVQNNLVLQPLEKVQKGFDVQQKQEIQKDLDVQQQEEVQNDLEQSIGFDFIMPVDHSGADCLVESKQLPLSDDNDDAAPSVDVVGGEIVPSLDECLSRSNPEPSHTNENEWISETQESEDIGFSGPTPSEIVLKEDCIKFEEPLIVPQKASIISSPKPVIFACCESSKWMEKSVDVVMERFDTVRQEVKVCAEVNVNQSIAVVDTDTVEQPKISENEIRAADGQTSCLEEAQEDGKLESDILVDTLDATSANKPKCDDIEVEINKQDVDVDEAEDCNFATVRRVSAPKLTLYLRSPSHDNSPPKELRRSSSVELLQRIEPPVPLQSETAVHEQVAVADVTKPEAQLSAVAELPPRQGKKVRFQAEHDVIVVQQPSDDEDGIEIADGENDFIGIPLFADDGVETPRIPSLADFAVPLADEEDISDCDTDTDDGYREEEYKEFLDDVTFEEQPSVELHGSDDEYDNNGAISTLESASVATTAQQYEPHIAALEPNTHAIKINEPLLSNNHKEPVDAQITTDHPQVNSAEIAECNFGKSYIAPERSQNKTPTELEFAMDSAKTVPKVIETGQLNEHTPALSEQEAIDARQESDTILRDSFATVEVDPIKNIPIANLDVDIPVDPAEDTRIEAVNPTPTDLNIAVSTDAPKQLSDDPVPLDAATPTPVVEDNGMTSPEPTTVLHADQSNNIKHDNARIPRDDDQQIGFSTDEMVQSGPLIASHEHAVDNSRKESSAQHNEVAASHKTQHDTDIINTPNDTNATSAFHEVTDDVISPDPCPSRDSFIKDLQAGGDEADRSSFALAQGADVTALIPPLASPPPVEEELPWPQPRKIVIPPCHRQLSVERRKSSTEIVARTDKAEHDFSTSEHVRFGQNNQPSRLRKRSFEQNEDLMESVLPPLPPSQPIRTARPTAL